MRHLIYTWIALSLLQSCIQNQVSDALPEASFHLTPDDLPGYEHDLDHARLINGWNNESLERGRIIYRTTCYACHGDQHQPGSLPHSRKFWEETFKQGHDPFALYQTITRGFGQMPAQTQLVPQQKYDVIHFIREFLIKEQQPNAYFSISDDWLATLPQGTQEGPAAGGYHPWKDMDYGNWLIHCYEIADQHDPPKEISGGRAPLPNEDHRKVNFAYKGIAMRLDHGPGGVAQGQAFALFDHDLLRFAGAWTGEGFIDWEGILFDDQHNVYPRTEGALQAANPMTPGWANPEDGTYTDTRIRGLDTRPFGPLPRAWAHYKGLYKYNDQLIIKYTVDQATIYETYSGDTLDQQWIFDRVIQVSENKRPLEMRLFPDSVEVKVITDYATLSQEQGFHILKIPANQACKIRVLFSKNKFQSAIDTDAIKKIPDLRSLTTGGEMSHAPKVSSTIIEVAGPSAYDIDIFTLPLVNPWKSRLRPTGIDFIREGNDAVVCTIDGEIWKITNITQRNGLVTWQRIATGLFQPLGIKVYRGKIYVSCRDQIVCLHDLNGDEEIDYYESFNSDHQVTEHFHEFAMGLQVDSAGNFYYAKSGRHARTSLVPQHGTLMKVSADGQHSTILANGFRAANGVCLNPDGSFFVTDQEGYWNPVNRINRVTPGGFYGNMWGYGAPADSADHAMEKPLCWIDMKYDRSPAELLWVESNQWGPLNGSLLSLSYGYGKIFVVLNQQLADDQFQGGIVELPVPQFPTGLIRGRFNPIDGQLYTCGMSAWATNQMLQSGGLYRVRYNPQKTLTLPFQMKVTAGNIHLQFTGALDQAPASEIKNYSINTWQLQRSRNYGSKRLDPQTLEIRKIDLSKDQRSVSLHVPTLQPTWVIEIVYQLKDKKGEDVKGAIQGTIHQLSNHNL